MPPIESKTFIKVSISSVDRMTLAPPARANDPNSPFNAPSCLGCASFEILLLTIVKISRGFFIFPCLFIKSSCTMPSCANAPITSLVGAANRVNMFLMAVAPWLPLIPALPIMAVMAATSSRDAPNSTAIGAPIFIVSNISSTVTLALLTVATRTSLTLSRFLSFCAVSFTLRPKDPSKSLEKSATWAKSSPDAVARFIMEFSAPIASALLNPARARKSNALALWAAVNSVTAPASLAALLDLIRASSNFVAPEVTSLYRMAAPVMASSNSIYPPVAAASPV